MTEHNNSKEESVLEFTQKTDRKEDPISERNYNLGLDTDII
jgi:hypothetical protein